MWRKHIPIRPQKELNNKIFITDDHIREALTLIEEKWKDKNTTLIFKLLVYSGIRLEHAWRLLNEFDERKLLIENDVAMYPIESIAKGKKKGYFAFMPADFATQLDEWNSNLSHRTFYVRLGPVKWKPPVDNPVSPIRIRAWFQNFAIEHGVRIEALRFIVGHSPATVGEAHYYNLKKIAKDEYRELLGKFPI